MSKLKLLQKMLRIMAILVLKKYDPKIVSVTGSVGKTSTKEAIFTVLASQFRVRRNEKNYNNEIGIPLTIIGASSGQSSFLGWLGVFLKWIGVMISPLEYPEILILEMGADRPGDIEYLTGFIKSDVGIITDVSPSHIEFFKSLEEISKEKGTLVKKLDEKSLAVINIDNSNVAKLKEQIRANLLTIGFLEEAEMRATDPAFVYADENNHDIKGLSFKLNYKGTTIPVRLNNVLAKHQIYPALAAAATGIWFQLNLVEIAAALENFASPCGRLNLISGIKNSLIIDDTYNSSPTSAIAALDVLKEIKDKRKIVVMGDMLELGAETERGHRNIAKKFLEVKGNIFLGVGQRMQFAIEEISKHNFPKDNIFSFCNPMEAGKKLQEIVQPEDLILIKGSQGMRMEKVVEEVMAQPQKADELLCRQNEEWRNIPFKEV
ncbi:MAG: UDP-N-acetylmuramoyl-tripeptide--D-alanyl-D-alanine ligase [Parcubacteria group bacterium]|jgi:UDP-N-acetylmuramoyl-tripeptide--D-alanyl-D-alanine ligase